jgi:hypothetical protein
MVNAFIKRENGHNNVGYIQNLKTKQIYYNLIYAWDSLLDIDTGNCWYITDPDYKEMSKKLPTLNELRRKHIIRGVYLNKNGKIEPHIYREGELHAW